MAEFFIDAEPLSFSGPAPASLADLIGVIEPVLHERGRVLAEVRLDGAAVTDEIASAAWLQVKRIEVRSLSVREALARVATGLAERAQALVPEADRLASEVLRRAWTEIAPSCIALATTVGELLRDAQGIVQGYPEMAASANGLAESADAWIAGIEKGDAASICLALDQRVLPALRAFHNDMHHVGAAP